MAAKVKVKYNFKQNTIAILLLCTAFMAAGIFVYGKILAKPTDTEQLQTIYALDTQISLKAYAKDDSSLTKVTEEIYRLEKLLSATDKNSDIYAVNHSEGKAVAVAEDTLNAVNFALDMAAKTHGTLEPTLYPVLTAWGFTTGNYHVPEDKELQQLLNLVDYRNVKVDASQHTITLPAAMELDLGAVGKGYIGDKVIELFKANGVESAIINLGGNVQTLGTKPDGSLWKIGIKAPDSNAYLGTISIADGAVITSGAYERFFIGADGQKYGHILSARTGRPVENNLSSVTIIGREGKVCDALSTALFVMGEDAAVDYWRQQRNFDMVLATKDGRLYLSEGIQCNFTLLEAGKDFAVTVVK